MPIRCARRRVVYRQYLKDRSLLDLEAQAKAQKRGLWALPEAERIPPWEWRHAARDQRQDAQAGEGRAAGAVPPSDPRPSLQFGSADGASAAGSFSCTPLKTCRQMASCAEAKYQL